jgi:hypothetical protein
MAIPFLADTHRGVAFGIFFSNADICANFFFITGGFYLLSQNYCLLLVLLNSTGQDKVKD